MATKKVAITLVICARRHGEPIVTSDPLDLQRLDPRARLVVL